MTSQSTALVWIDTETTGLVAHERSLLEIACVITDMDLNVLTDAPFHAVVHYDDAQARALYEQSDDIVRKMHTATGLWSRLSSGSPLAQIEADLLSFIREHAPQPRSAHLAGNSLRLDFNFIDEHLPEVGRHLHYTTVDVSSLAVLVKSVTGARVRKASDHTAETDILEALAELRILWGPLRKYLEANPDAIAPATPAAEFPTIGAVAA